MIITSENTEAILHYGANIAHDGASQANMRRRRQGLGEDVGQLLSCGHVADCDNARVDEARMK